MSLSFTVAALELPTFNAVIANASVGEPVQLSGGGWTGEAWPKGLFAKIVDAASAPSKLDAMTPELEASFARAGLTGSFLAFVSGSSRGVVVARGRSGVSLHVPVLATPADYLLAVHLAAAAARLASTHVVLDDPNAANATRSIEPDALIAEWTEEAADAHARQVGTWLAEDMAGAGGAAGRTYFFQGPRGFVELGPKQLAAIEGSTERFDHARGLLMSGTSAKHRVSMRPVVTAVSDARREAVLLTASMVFAAGADGILADEEARQLEAHFATVKELVAFPARELLDAVKTDVPNIEALSELDSPLLRKKAFVLASEVIASARDGKLGGEPTDPNVQAVSALAKALSLDDDQMFVAQVVHTVMAKYEAAPDADDTLANRLALGMLLTAAADGHIDEKEAAVLSALARTVPELKTRDVGALFAAAKAYMAKGSGLDGALDDLAALTRCKNKCFALATEVALITGRGPEGTMLPRLLSKVGPDRDYADAAIATFAAKYA